MQSEAHFRLYTLVKCNLRLILSYYYMYSIDPPMIIFTKDIAEALTAYLASKNYDKTYLVTDTNTRQHCLPLLEGTPALRDAGQITIEAGDVHKDIAQVAQIWQHLSDGGASRHSLLINLGGGMVTDLGGFAGATFKRGLHVLNIPTTLMASVDAAVGGKTGINFNGLKNEIGSFHQPDCVMIDCTFLRTLDRDNLLSGLAEMIKHGLIADSDHLRALLTIDISTRHFTIDPAEVERSVAVKARIVEEDPTERGIRKALNFGHTIGHAFESLSFARSRPILHGHAVAAGIVCELYLSHKHCGLSTDDLRRVTHFIRSGYPPFSFSCRDYDTIYERMTHDKKNAGGRIRFALLRGIGDVVIDQEVPRELVIESFDFYRENMGQ